MFFVTLLIQYFSHLRRYCYEKKQEVTRNIAAYFFKVQAYFISLHLEICASQIFMAGNGFVINTIRLACLEKSNGQPFTLSPEGLFFHAPYSVSNQSNKSAENLEMCENRVNTHTHTF